jgi:hypothetical protein
MQLKTKHKTQKHISSAKIVSFSKKEKEKEKEKERSFVRV